MTLEEINEQEWRNPENWSGSLAGFYFSKKDTRTWVPKKVRAFGWTLNLGRPAGARWMLGFLVGLPLAMLFLGLGIGMIQ